MNLKNVFWVFHQFFGWIHWACYCKHEAFHLHFCHIFSIESARMIMLCRPNIQMTTIFVRLTIYLEHLHILFWNCKNQILIMGDYFPKFLLNLILLFFLIFIQELLFSQAIFSQFIVSFDSNLKLSLLLFFKFWFQN